MNRILEVFTYKVSQCSKSSFPEYFSMMGEKEGEKGFSIYLKRTWHLPSKPVEKVFPSHIHPWSEVDLFLVPFPFFFFFPFFLDSHRKYITKGSQDNYLGTKHFTNNQLWHFAGVKSCFDTTQGTLRRGLISLLGTPHGETEKKKKPTTNLTCFLLSGFWVHALSQETDVAWFLHGVVWGDVGE